MTPNLIGTHQPGDQSLLDLLQHHTVNLYQLANRTCEVSCVMARTLLLPCRFDLFAKLYYIRHRNDDPSQALKVYTAHIKAFNPDGKEPGRDDKQTVDDFVACFNRLIDQFAASPFDASVSVVPVDADGVILDGGHRVAALAYLNKEVVIARYQDVHSVADFDYMYFLKRGLSRRLCDMVALETVAWCKDLYVACFWPRMGGKGEKQKAMNRICDFTNPFYVKSHHISLKSLSRFISQVYRAQSWVGTEADHYHGAVDKASRCYASNAEAMFVFFTTSKGLDAVLQLKEDIRSEFPYDKDSIHITDTQDEATDIAYRVLSQEGMSMWQDTLGYRGWVARLYSYVDDRLFVFKNVYFTRMKVYAYSWMRRFHR